MITDMLEIKIFLELVKQFAVKKLNKYNNP